MPTGDQFRSSDTLPGVLGRGLGATGLRLRLSRELPAAWLRLFAAPMPASSCLSP
jgi:hypothetical protein